MATGFVSCSGNKAELSNLHKINLRKITSRNIIFITKVTVDPAKRVCCLMWNPKVHHHLDRSLPLVRVLPRCIQVTATPYFITILILFSDLRLDFPNHLFPSGRSAKML